MLCSFIAIVFLSSLLVDLRVFKGMSRSEKQLFLLNIIYLFPSYFHLILCMERNPVIRMLNDAEDKEESKEKAKFLHRSMSMDSQQSNENGGGFDEKGNGLNNKPNLFRGGSFDEKFFNAKSTTSFEPGFGFDQSGRQNSFEDGGLGGFSGSSANLMLDQKKEEGIELVTSSKPEDIKVGEAESGITGTL